MSGYLKRCTSRPDDIDPTTPRGFAIGTTNAAVLIMALPVIGTMFAIGMTVLEKARNKAELGTPVLILTARDELENRMKGLNAGALCQIFRERVATPAIVAMVLGAASVISILMLVRWMLGSVHRAADLTFTIGVEHPERRIPLEDLPKEIRPLASSANQALDRLTETYLVERRFTADAAHALRTPLTVLDLRIQKAIAEKNPDWTAISKDMGQIRHLVDQLLALACRPR